MTAHEKITLGQAREQIKQPVARKKERNFRASDFLTDEERQKLRQNNLRGKSTRKYSVIDAYIAEIIARFGYETYQAWKVGEISEQNMVKYIQAERARESARNLSLEAIIVASLAGAQQPQKHGRKPPIKTAIKILESEQKKAKGEA